MSTPQYGRLSYSHDRACRKAEIQELKGTTR